MKKIRAPFKPVYFAAFLIIGLAACKTAHLKTASNTSFGGGFPDKEIPSVAPKSENSTTEAVPERIQTANETAIQTNKPSKQISNTRNLVKAYRVLHSLKHVQYTPQTDSTATTPPTQKPMEPTARIGFWLVIGGLITSFIPYINLLSGLAILAGFILGIIALSKIKQSNNELRGRGKAIAAIVIPAVLVFLAIVAVFLLVLAFAAL